MTKPDAVTCPADGCEYEGLHGSVCAHYSGKKDENHSGGYEKAKGLIAQQGDGEAADRSADRQKTAANVTAANFPGDRDEAGGSGQGDSGDLDSGLSCPRCNEKEELYEAGAVLRDVPDKELTGEYRELLEGSDAVCGTCGGVFDV